MIEGLSVFLVLATITLSALLNVASFLFLWFYIPYVAWIILFDRSTGSNGGRQWLFLRRWGLLKCFRAYFDPSFVIEKPLDPNDLYIFGIHPHGIMTMALWANFVAETAALREIPFRMVTLSINLWVPFFRELLLWTGFIASDKKSVLRCLKKYKTSVTITVGGAEESLMTKSGIILDKRKGFIEIALRSGASLVPVYNFGEREIFPYTYEPGHNSWFFWCQRKLKALTWCTLPVFLFYPSPSVHVVTVIGAPIPVEKRKKPTQEEIDALHATYKKALLDLHERHREKYGEPKLCIKY